MTSLTHADRALELFRRRPAVENPADWVANELLALAADSGRLSLRIAHSAEGKGPSLECSDPSNSVTSDESGPLRLFRTVLARFAKLAEEECGTAFDPYAGNACFDRTGPSGLVRLDVDYTNTTQDQSISITTRR
jgi:hypothetical protein